MEIFDQMLEIVLGTVVGLIGNVALYAIIGGAIGITLGIYIMRKLKSIQIFNRPGKLWSFAAKTSYFFVPTAMFFLGMAQGSVWGFHTTAVNLIEDATNPIIEYAEDYIPQLQSFVNAYVIPEGSTAEEIVNFYNESQRDSDGFMMNSFNSMVLGGALELSPLSSDFVDPINRLKSINLAELDRGLFELLPSFMKAYAALLLAPLYWACFAPFGIYFLWVFAEVLIYKKLFSSLILESSTHQNLHPIAG